MGLKINRKDDLDKLLGKFTQLDPKDDQRDKFMKKADQKQQNKAYNKNKILNQDQTNKS